jgi:hypothetical protein
MATTANINININSKDAQQNVNKLSSSINGASSSAANLKLELRQITRELQSLQPGSARFQELSLRAGELRDQIADTNAVVGQLAGNIAERLTRGITGVVSIGVAGFQTLAAGVALFGGESEELQKTMVRLQALMNLSQALETFAGLDQKLVEIRASFQSLTVATEVQTVAQEGENIATAQGTVATTALGVAMKALPIIAIAAAIGTLVYGLYSYASASEEAAKEEEKRKKQREATLKLQKETIEYVGKESVSFTSLIYQLKSTNKNSERRKELIKDINKQYGTTLKNLSDENMFQEQLNQSVADYITLSYNKFKLDKNYEYQQQQNQKRFEGEQKINKARREAQDLVDKGIRKSIGDALSYRQDLREAIAEGTKMTNEADKALASLGLRREQLIAVEDKLTLGGKRYVEQTDKSTDSTKDLTEETEKYAELLAKIQNELSRQVQAEQELEKAKTNRIKNVEEKEIKLLEQQYGEERQKIIDGATQREIAAFEEKFKKEGKTREEYDKGIADIKAKADGNLLDSEKKLLEQKKIYLDEDIKNIQEKYDRQEEITINSTKLIQDQIQLMDLEFQKEQEIREINNAEMTEEKKQEAIIEVRKKYLDKEIELIKQSAEDQRTALRLVKDQQLDNDELTAEQRTEIEEKYNQEVLKLNQDTQTKIQEAIDGTKTTQETALESLTKTIDVISQYVDKIAEIWSQAGDLIAQRNQERFEAQSQQIDNLYNKEKEALDGQLENELISREQYDNKIKELDQQRAEEEKQLAMKKFNEQKKLQIVNATIQGTQAVLAAYSSGAATPIIGVATGPIYAAIAAAFAAAQVAAIANQTFTAAEGGIVPGMGPGNIDSVPSLLAPGEFVINSQSAKMYPELLSNINERGGGKKLVPDLPPSNAQGVPSTVFQQDRVQQPIKAYVVETDISDSQKRVNRIKRSVEF